MHKADAILPSLPEKCVLMDIPDNNLVQDFIQDVPVFVKIWRKYWVFNFLSTLMKEITSC
ncbi:MAG: hypothetical protein IPI90_12505 [Saprospiraceae bacterium]|nr:hypothetical protein [Candidatus Vicinibacter affinis]